LTETVCVTGAGGGIGRALLEQLTGPYRVKALFRTQNAVSDAWTERGCSPVWGDLSDEAALSELVTDATFVFHCAALTSRAPYELAYAVNVEGTRRLTRVAAAHGCKRLVHVSSVAVYGGSAAQGDCSEGLELREHDGMDVYSLTKLQSETALRDAALQHGVEFTVVRPTSVYGPNTKPFTIVPLDLIGKGRPVVLGDGEGFLDVVYVDDVAKALVLAAQSDKANCQAFNIGHENVTFNDFYGRYAEMLNRPARHLPLWVIRSAVRLLERAPGSLKERSSELRKTAGALLAVAEGRRRYPSTKAESVLGYAPQTSLSTGMLKTELWARREGLVPPNSRVLEGTRPMSFRPLAVAHPTSEAEISEILGIARSTGVAIRAVGSLHSSSPVPETDGICLVLDRWREIEGREGRLVTVQGGMKLRDLNEALAEVGLALPVSGAVTDQTVAGAISTATHGGSIHHGTLSDYVEAMRIVKPDGSVVELDRSQDLFNAAGVSVGLLGVVSSVTFRCVDAFLLRGRSTVRTMPEVIADFDLLNRSALYTDMLYFPATDQVEVLSIDAAEGEAAEPATRGRRGRSARAPWARSSVSRRLESTGAKGVFWLVSRVKPARRVFTKLSVGSSYRVRSGRSDLVLAFSEGGADQALSGIQDMEIAIAYDQAAEALSLLRDRFLTTHEQPLLPIHIRCSASSDLWLSPTYKRDVCWLEFWQQPSERLFEEAHALLSAFHYRFHWGKAARADRAYIRGQFERWDDFERLRAEWDPDGMFLNDYLKSFFHPE